MVVKADLQRPGVCKATDMELTPRLRASRSSRATSAAIYVPGQKSPVTRPRSKSRRRAGRPITYKDNPDAKNLTEGERRKVKRRIANRESARRVRARRAETLEELQIKMGHLSDANAKYIDRVTEAEESKDEAEGQIRLFQHKLQEITADNQALHRQVDMLEKRLSPTDLHQSGLNSAFATHHRAQTAWSLSPPAQTPLFNTNPSRQLSLADFP